jgi:hypothetical protein
MLVTKQFDMGEVIFEIIKPFIPDAKSGDLVESDKWMVLIHKGTVSWFAGGQLLDMKTRKTALFPSPKDALKAAVDFAHHCGLRDA